MEYIYRILKMKYFVKYQYNNWNVKIFFNLDEREG